jgi:hypothetical protein
MRRLLALLVLLAFAGAPAVDTALAAKPKPTKSKKHRACEKKAKKIKSKRKRKAALKKCVKKHGKKKPPVKKLRPKPKPLPPLPVTPATPPFTEGGVGDAVVVAVLDSATNPYHFDFRASKMPQHLDGDPANDVPLDRPFTEWLPGAAGAPLDLQRVDLSLPEDPDETSAALAEADGDKLKIKPSTPDRLHAAFFPGTKIIGAASFQKEPNMFAGNGSHGVGTTSSAVGNLHGTCPECLLFFVHTGGSAQTGEAAIDWAMKQPWIDVITNSYGFSITNSDRTRFYDQSNTELQAQASERGQTVFFSSGNGNDGAFVTPNQTTYSSQEGPDWIVTVGAVSPPEGGYYSPVADTSDSDGESASYTGAGKPADVAGIGSDYPTAYESKTIGGTGTFGFGGTSNATPQVAGLYSRGLYMARKALRGPSRTQGAGLVAVGAPVACGPARPDCELGDGKLTAAELRTRLFHGAVHTAAGFGVTGQGVTDDPSAPPVGEEEFLNEGHGSYMGRVWEDRNEWTAEFERIAGPMTGATKALERPAGEQEWMVVDSYCRQKNWGSWTQGYYVDGKTELPPPDPSSPVRTQRMQTCPGGPTPLPDAVPVPSP